jgi:hypothetical protein
MSYKIRIVIDFGFSTTHTYILNSQLFILLSDQKLPL